MSKRNRAIRAARPRQPSVTKVKSPEDTIAMIPYLLGFTPAESIVVVAIQGPRKRFGPCFRIDLLPPDEAADEAAYVVSLIRRHRFDQVLVVAFSESKGRADPVIEAVLARLERHGVAVVDAFRADGRRWWSYVCSDPVCCHPDGTPYDVDTSRVAAEAVLAGMQKAPDRDALREQFRPVSPQRQAEVGDAVERLRTSSDWQGPRQVLRQIPDIVGGFLDDPARLTVDDVALLAAAMQDIAVRDQAWLMMTRANAVQHYRLWLTVMRQVPDALLAPVGALTAFAAWLTGKGVLASHASERVDSVDPDYYLNRLVRDALQGAVNPAVWDEMPLSALRQCGT